jgi:hypothetical protein
MDLINENNASNNQYKNIKLNALNKTINNFKPEYLEKLELPNIDYGQFIKKPNYFIPDAFDKNLKKEAFNYQKITEDPRYIERAKNLDKEFNTNFEEKLNQFHNKGNSENKNITTKQQDYFPHNISTANEIPYEMDGEKLDALGISKNSYLGKMKFLSKEIDENQINKFHPDDREIIINKKRGIDENIDTRGTIHHELKHNWTNTLKDAPKYQDFLKEGVIPKEANDFLPRKNYDYYTNPTEIDAHLHTNFRDEMVKKGYLKDHFDNLTKDNLDKFIKENPNYRGVEEYFKPGKEIIYDRNKFINTFNKALPVAMFPGLYYLNQQSNK